MQNMLKKENEGQFFCKIVLQNNHYQIVIFRTVFLTKGTYTIVASIPFVGTNGIFPSLVTP